VSNQIPSEADMVAMLEKFHYIDQLLRACDLEDRFTEQIPQITGRINPAASYYFEKLVLADLVDDQRWRGLAGRPKQFDQELKRVLKRIQGFMKARYGIHAHHPAQKERRDAQIYDLHHSRSAKTFGQIGIKLGISANAAERACQRHEKRERVAKQYLMDLFDWVERYAVLLLPAGREATQQHQNPQ
jgi:hypothetical protein